MDKRGGAMNLFISSSRVLAALIFMQAVLPLEVDAKSGEELRAMYTKFLKKEGYQPEVDGDGDVVFKHEGKTYFIDVHDKDSEFFMIALPNIWPIESSVERRKVLAAADETNQETKMAKIYTKGDNVWVTAESFVAIPEDFEDVFKRMLSSIVTAVDLFADKMRE
ncbi:MAG TPA: hypothetical protein PK490_10745 [Prosthecobacter sp.]|nr:hypothetical protein [Prosthecobacter sp.]HRK14761.1 hypothetical protein [Prosthecobacter sp.]